MTDKIILMKNDSNNYYPQTLASEVYRPNKSTSVETTLAKLEADIKKVVDKYNESYPLNVWFIDNSWAIYGDETSVAYLTNSAQNKRVCSETLIYIDRATTITFEGSSDYQFTMFKSQNACGYKSAWCKDYTEGNSYLMEKGFYGITIKKVVGGEEQELTRHDKQNYNFTLTPSTL